MDVVCLVRELSSTADIGPLHQLSSSSSQPFDPDRSRSSVGGTTTLLISGGSRDTLCEEDVAAEGVVEGVGLACGTTGTAARSSRMDRPLVR